MREGGGGYGGEGRGGGGMCERYTQLYTSQPERAVGDSVIFIAP